MRAALQATFAETGHTMRLLEAAAAAVALTEPLLLVGEAGTGKTALVQHLAQKVCFCISYGHELEPSDLTMHACKCHKLTALLLMVDEVGRGEGRPGSAPCSEVAPQLDSA